jgi:hypothetical protein
MAPPPAAAAVEFCRLPHWGTSCCLRAEFWHVGRAGQGSNAPTQWVWVNIVNCQHSGLWNFGTPRSCICEMYSYINSCTDDLIQLHFEWILVNVTCFCHLWSIPTYNGRAARIAQEARKPCNLSKLWGFQGSLQMQTPCQSSFGVAIREALQRINVSSFGPFIIYQWKWRKRGSSKMGYPQIQTLSWF